MQDLSKRLLEEVQQVSRGVPRDFLPCATFTTPVIWGALVCLWASVITEFSDVIDVDT